MLESDQHSDKASYIPIVLRRLLNQDLESVDKGIRLFII